MIGLAVGIDYALFIVSRHREQLSDPNMSVGESIGRAIGTAGSAVVFAGLTVVIALSALSAARIPFLTAMELAAAGTVASAVIVALTLVPALLGFMGERVRPRANQVVETQNAGKAVSSFIILGPVGPVDSTGTGRRASHRCGALAGDVDSGAPHAAWTPEQRECSQQAVPCTRVTSC